MLRTSTRNVAYEVISCLIDQNGKGVLTEIIKFLTTSNKHIVEENGSSILDSLHKKTNYYGRYHNHQVGKNLSQHVPRVDESEEDTESYVSGHASPPIVKNKGSSMSIGSSSQSNNGDIRIKIRKNSIEPYQMAKATH